MKSQDCKDLLFSYAVSNINKITPTLNKWTQKEIEALCNGKNWTRTEKYKNNVGQTIRKFYSKSARIRHEGYSLFYILAYGTVIETGIDGPTTVEITIKELKNMPAPNEKEITSIITI